MLQEVELTISELFDIISQEERISYETDVEYFQDMTIEILDEFNDWILVNGLIVKEDKTTELYFDNTSSIRCANKHLISTPNGLKPVSDISLDEVVTNRLDDVSTVINITTHHTEKVYDLEVNSASHLYQTANGTIHHNTLLTAGLIHYANQLNMRTITVVPSSSLLKQTADYISRFDIPVGKFGGGKKEDADNIVATWQTLQNNMSYIKDFECVIWDECHTAKAYVAKQILDRAINSFIRVGLTGTIPKDPLDKANLMGAFGEVLMTVNAKSLQDRNMLSSIEINVFKLLYDKKYKNYFADWQEESSFLQSNEQFIEFINVLIGELEGNTLILIKNIDPAEKLSENLKCQFISSKLKLNQRQEAFEKFEYGKRHVAVGTYSLLSTGIDIVHINNLILAPTAGKSFTKIIQSLGRGLRRESGKKEHVNVYDISSNLKYDQKHLKERKSFYDEAGYPHETTDFDLNNI